MSAEEFAEKMKQRKHWLSLIDYKDHELSKSRKEGFLRIIR